MSKNETKSAEAIRLQEDATRAKNWKRWGPYLSERQWATVREDYSPGGTCWEYFPHEQARSRAYRWGEDGLLGITDRECRLCFALALWNGRDPILKERLFGLTSSEGNHGEDVKEQYFYLDSTPTHSYLKALYKYPQAEYPYARLVEENRRRGRNEPEFELTDTGVFDDNRYFDVFAEYAKNSPDDILIRITATNRGPEAATLHLLPTIWFRNTWSWGCAHEGCSLKPRIRRHKDANLLEATHETLGKFFLAVGPAEDRSFPPFLFTENESNSRLLWGAAEDGAFAKDAFHGYVVHGRQDVVNSQSVGTKVAPHYVLDVAAGQSCTVPLRLFSDAEAPPQPLGADFDSIFSLRKREADEYYASVTSAKLSDAERNVARQGYAGLLWSKQFYHYVVQDWLEGDPAMPPPPASRRQGRNHDWAHLYSRDVISMPDKWEYPWFAAWDLAFHMIPFARIDPRFAKEQIILFLREWYMHPNGQIPAYEFAFGDVNPPVHAWAAWRVYKIAARRGDRDRDFLESVFQKLLLNFTWWVNRKDAHGKNLFSGGFLGLDNIGVFDRSKPLPTGGTLQQADGTAWMAFYCATMLSIALELAHDGGKVRTAYEDMASKFLEHFVQIADAMNTLGGTGLWDETDGFYYDQIRFDNSAVPLKTRSMVGLLPLIAVEVLEEESIQGLPGFSKRLAWFVKHRQDLSRHITHCECDHGHRLVAIPSRERLERVLRYMLDENEFLSPYGIRSLSKFHQKNPYEFHAGGDVHRVEYVPGESNTGLFGGNSNWRGPIWFPTSYLLIEAIERYHHFYGDHFKVECPTGSGKRLTLHEVSQELSRRLAGIFLAEKNGRRPCHGNDARWAKDPHWRDLVLFHEYFHGETGQGLGAGHQTGWTALVIRQVEDLARHRNKQQPVAAVA
ncbi:MAG: glucosidase [Verrucomicrobia bacterium]|nr:MAG: glucosidase [Verrucomicrobiota bacterium]